MGSVGAAILVILPPRAGISSFVSLIAKSQLQFAQPFAHVGVRALENVLHFPGQTVGLVNAPNLRIAIARPEQTGELAVAIQTLVIHFDDEDVIKPGENILQTRRQRADVTDVNGRDTVAAGAR